MNNLLIPNKTAHDDFAMNLQDNDINMQDNNDNIDFLYKKYYQ